MNPFDAVSEIEPRARGRQRQHCALRGAGVADPQAAPSPALKVTVQVHEYPGGTLAVFHGPRRLAGYRPDGAL